MQLWIAAYVVCGLLIVGGCSPRDDGDASVGNGPGHADGLGGRADPPAPGNNENAPATTPDTEPGTQPAPSDPATSSPDQHCALSSVRDSNE